MEGWTAEPRSSTSESASLQLIHWKKATYGKRRKNHAFRKFVHNRDWISIPPQLAECVGQQQLKAESHYASPGQFLPHSFHVGGWPVDAAAFRAAGKLVLRSVNVWIQLILDLLLLHVL